MKQGQAGVKASAWWQYRAYCLTLRGLWRVIGGRIEVSGLENMPRTGPCILISNHQSYLDPPFLATVIPRVIHPMAKSTQFNTPLLGRWLSHVYVFPVRRYQTDPQAARSVLRRLAAGAAVLIYIEGERSWDGRLQPLRLGVLKLILKAGVPVIPVRVDGAYEAWPRWHKLRPGTIAMRFGKPLTFPKLEHRRDRTPTQIAAVRDALTQALRGSADVTAST
jgi:1-acyl-sn-glycerol-3-phosphate acyltransferase